MKKPAWAAGTAATGTATVTVTPKRSRRREQVSAHEKSPTAVAKDTARVAKVTVRGGENTGKPPRVRPGAAATDVGPKWMPGYLAALAKNGGQRIAAAKAAKVGYTTIYRHRETDASFEKDEADVMRQVQHNAESEAIRRAVEGVVSLYTTKDGTIHRERKFSDTLLLRLLERFETGSWRQKQQIEHSGGMTFKTRAERKEALEKARAALQQSPVTAIHGRS